jgi:hypothetical protein
MNPMIRHPRHGTIAVPDTMETARPFHPTRRTWHTLLALAVSIGIHCAASGQNAPSVNESLLNVSESELQARLPDLRRTAKPILGPRGLRGLWSMSETTPQGLVLDTVVYMRSGNVQRIEQRWASRAPNDCQPARLSTLAQPIERRFGAAAMASDDAMDADTQQHTTLWTLGEAEARLVLTRTGERCAALIVYTPRVTPDASEL